MADTMSAMPKIASGLMQLGVLQISKFRVTGMHCSSCSTAVQKALSVTPGVERASVSLTLEQAEVVYDPGLVKEVSHHIKSQPKCHDHRNHSQLAYWQHAVHVCIVTSSQILNCKLPLLMYCRKDKACDCQKDKADTVPPVLIMHRLSLCCIHSNLLVFDRLNSALCKYCPHDLSLSIRNMQLFPTNAMVLSVESNLNKSLLLEHIKHVETNTRFCNLLDLDVLC